VTQPGAARGFSDCALDALRAMQDVDVPARKLGNGLMHGLRIALPHSGGELGTIGPTREGHFPLSWPEPHRLLGSAQRTSRPVPRQAPIRAAVKFSGEAPTVRSCWRDQRLVLPATRRRPIGDAGHPLLGVEMSPRGS
jgi:hypothetical protein